MPRAKKIEVAPEEVAEQPVVKVEAAPSKTEFLVLNASGGEVRVYSHELHGEDAEKLAHQYAGKIGGSVQ
jgi:hypothetical protein